MKALKTLILASNLIFLLIELTACSSTPPKTHSTQNMTVNVPIVTPPKKIKPVPKAKQPPPDSSGYIAQGKASWFGINHHGAKMANGELYDLYGMTAAHATLPLFSRVQVTNLLNDRKVIVTITDRLPETESQHFLLKLSYWAARQIGLDKAFSAPVEVRGLASKSSKSKKATTVSQPNDIYLKVGSFSNPNDAYKLRNQLSNPFQNRVFVQQKANQYQVRLGPFANWNESDSAIRVLQKYGIRNVLVVPKTEK